MLLLSSSSTSSSSSSSELNMDSSDFPVSRSPRKELQGPRPPALKVRKDSHKIKKPPVAPQPSRPPQQHLQQTQPRPPVIIYTVSPKVIHTNPSDFMSLVQRLTGSSSSSSSYSSYSSSSSSSSSSSFSSSYSTSTTYNTAPNPFNHDGGAISPAARYAVLEKAKSPKEKMLPPQQAVGDVGFLEGIEMSQVMERSGSYSFPGILSPGPASLPAISPNFFSPPSDPNMLSFLHDLSPVVFHGNRNFIEGSFMPSPSTFVSPRFTSPTPSIDLFNNFNNFFEF